MNNYKPKELAEIIGKLEPLHSEIDLLKKTGCCYC